MSDKHKNLFITFVLSMLPGVGHYYLGLMNRGLQFMLAFVGAITIGASLDFPVLGAFIPVIWFYAVFDALQMAEAINVGNPVEDNPVLPWDRIAQKRMLIGWSLIMSGIFLIINRIFAYYEPSLYFSVYAKTAVVATILIVVGIRILKPQKDNDRDSSSPSEGEINYDK